LFHFVAEDWAGRRSDFTAPIIFFSYGRRFDLQAIETVRGAYQASGAWRRDFGGQRVAFAPAREPGDTDLEAAFVYFSTYPDPHVPAVPPALAQRAAAAAVAPAAPASPDGICCGGQKNRVAVRPPWKPHVPRAEVKVPAVSTLNPPSTESTVPITWDDSYLKHGFTPEAGSLNFGELFANLDNVKIPFGLPAPRSVGLFKPDFDISGLSRKFGAVGGALDSLKLGQVDFGALFPRGAANAAKIFGFFDLADLLGPTSDIAALGGAIVPKVKTRVFYDGSGVPERAEAYLDWQPRLYKKTISVATFTPDENGGVAYMEVTVGTNGSELEAAIAPKPRDVGRPR
jgi:hypothetical protein